MRKQCIGISFGFYQITKCHMHMRLQRTQHTCSENHISCSEICPIVFGLFNGCLRICNVDTELIVKVKETISNELVRLFKPSSLEIAKSTPMLASILDPRYKRLPFLTLNNEKRLRTALEGRIDEVPLTRPLRDANKCQPIPSKRRKLDFLMFNSPERTE